MNLKTEDETKKKTIEIKNRVLYINGKVQKKHIFPPKYSDVLNVDQEEQIKLDKIELKQSISIKDRSSIFTGFATKAKSATEIHMAYKRVKQLVPEADHIVMAYSAGGHDGYHDDGEHSSAKRLLNIVADRNLTNVVVFVARVYGGIPLGHKRFILIDKVAKEALNKLKK